MHPCAIPAGGRAAQQVKCTHAPGAAGSGRENAGISRDSTDLGSSPCGQCGGKGRIPEVTCTLCGGWGATQAIRRVAVRIPPGIDSGMRIRKEGLGESRDQEIPDGDLYVEVTILPHPRLTRQGDDLEASVHLSPARAALGSITEVETIEGKMVRVEIPAGVQQDAAIRVKGEGVKTRDLSGDLVVRVKVDIPGKTTAGERDLYQRLLRIEERREGLKKKGLISRYFGKMRDE